MNIFKNKNYLLLILITIIGLFLRVWKINHLPFPPDGDEVAFGYYGWSLLNFGSDEYGNKFPLSFISIGDYKYPGLAYLNILPAAIFGLSDLTTRFWSVASGGVGIILVYILSHFITQNKRASIFSALFFAISPWSLIESRIGYENHLAFVLSLGGILIFLSYLGAIKNKNIEGKKGYLILSLLLFLISTLTYAAQRVFLPMYLLVIFVYTYFDKEFIKFRSKSLLVFLLISIVSVGLFTNPLFRGRAGEEIWKFTEGDSAKLEETYVATGVSEIKIHPRITWALKNKYTYTLIAFTDRYLSHFSPSFLFFDGEHSDEKIPAMGVLLFADIVLLPIGFITLLEQKKKKELLIFVWLLLAPISSALTGGGAHTNRASLMIVPLTIISGYGFWSLFNIKSKLFKKLSIFLVSAIIIWSSTYTIHQLFLVKPTLQPWYKQQVNRELTQKVLNLKDKYESVVVTDDDYIFYLFYGKISPKEFLANAKILSPEINRWQRVDKLYNIYFKMPFACPLSGKEKTLYVCKGVEVPQNAKLVDVVYFKDGLPAYTLIEFYPLSKRPSPLPPLPKRLQYMVDVEKPFGNPDGIIPPEKDYFW